MHIRMAQFAIGRDLRSNLQHILGVLDGATPGEMVVFPEGALSGYAPKDPAYLDGLDAAAIEDALGTLAARVGAIGCRCLVGSATNDGGHWRNAVILIEGPGKSQRYYKAELSSLDRRHFAPGPAAGELFTIGGVPIGVVACRELLFPEVWMRLKRRGAQVIFHLNNAVEPHDALWIHLLIARAIEQGVFVCSINNGAPPQQLPSVVIAPSGQVRLQTDVQMDQVVAGRIDLAEVVADLTTRTDY
jgi:predicted amidohydrolase